MDLLCSLCSPNSFTLLASCWAFFFSRHAREANLFFSRRDLDLTVCGSSTGGVMSVMALLSRHNSLPILNNLTGFGVTSLPSPRRAFPLCLYRMWLSSGSKTGSSKLLSTWGSWTSTDLHSRLPLGPLDWVLYCQK